MTEYTNKASVNPLTLSLQDRLTAELEQKINEFEKEESQNSGHFRLIDTVDVLTCMALVALFFIITVI
ncbi:hypothetical protein ACIQ4I_08015 [Rummeliibacillus sp. NPDC094406]|uniref:hypothetical protein n=1 Tax=Rummeliibacillus sp. NPDC094406 TaxID=3364511 RepID=UPI0038246F0B